MLASSIISCILVASGLAAASPAKRVEGLEILVSGPTSVDSVENLELLATVKNTGSSEARILKYGTILDGELPTRSFKVTKDGKIVDFHGVKLQVEPALANGTAYTVIPAGKSVQVKHQVGALYNFAPHGTGKFTFEPVLYFATGAPTALLKVDATSFNTVDIEIKNDVGKRELGAAATVLDKRATVNCGTTSQRNQISSSYTEGKSLASGASSYISSRGASDSLYRQYWGSYSTSSIIAVFNRVANENSGSRTLNCADPYGACSNGVIAYTVISTTNIYYCNPFYSEVTTSRLCSDTTVNSRNVRGGTTLHELTHATSNTDDVTYGCPNDIALSDSDSARNADSYNCFATQVYKNTKC